MTPIRASSHISPRLIASDPKGGLYAFNFAEKPLFCESTSSLRHTGLIFSLFAIPNSPGLLISFGMDSQIIAWKNSWNDWQSLTSVANQVCISSKVSSLSQGPGFCSPLAVGLSDGYLLLLNNVQPPAPNSSTSMTRWSPLPPTGAAVGITALAWHPDPQFEHLLAIGSSKGHIDVIDVRKQQKRGRNYNQVEGCVYRVSWGPRIFDLSKMDDDGNRDQKEIEGRLLVYAVANGSAYILLSLKKPPISLGSEFKSLLANTADWKLADIAFRQLDEKESNFSWLMALGSMSGAVNIFGLLKDSGSIEPLSRVDIHKKCIISMVWSRHIDKYLLAVGSCESFITVIDATELTSKSPSGLKVPEMTSCFAILQGHGSRISCLEWSPCDTDLLLSGSYDDTATVWRVGLSVSTAIANYRNHLSRVFACAWSPHDPDFVLSGEELGYLVGWRPSGQASKAPPAHRKHRNPLAKIPINLQAIVEEEVKEEIPHPEPELASGPQKRSEPFIGKKPSLLPGLFATPSVVDCSIPSLDATPPIRLQSRFSIILDFVAFMKDPSSIPEERILPEFDLLCAGDALTRQRLVRFTEAEALKHLSTSTTGPNRQARLDAYFSLLLWLGRADLVAKKCVEFQHMPFWLMWALEMMLRGVSPRDNPGCLLEGDALQTETALDDFLKHKVSFIFLKVCAFNKIHSHNYVINRELMTFN